MNVSEEFKNEFQNSGSIDTFYLKKIVKSKIIRFFVKWEGPQQ